MDGVMQCIFKLLFLCCALFVFCEPHSWAESERCLKVKRAESAEEARKYYSFSECRDIALERSVSFIPDNELKKAELKSFLESVDPLSINARHLLLSIYLKDSPEKAFLQYNLIRQLEPQFFTELTEAEILIRMGKSQQSLRILDKIILEHPGDLVARKLRAVAHFENKNFNDASTDLQFFLDGSQEKAPYQLAASKVFFKLGRKEKARAILVNISVDHVEDDSQLIAYGQLSENLGELVLAEKAYQAIASENAEKAILIARVLKKQRKIIESRQVLEAATTKFPNNESLLAEVYQENIEQGRVALAARLLEQWGESFPERDWIKKHLLGLRAKFVEDKKDSSNRGNPVSRLPKRQPAAQGKTIKLSTKRNTTSVREGESLMTISFRLFGTHQKWREILRANKD